MLSVFRAVLMRDLRLAARRRGQVALAIMFFVLAAAMFPFGIGGEPGRLADAAGGLVWVTALFAILLSLDRLFEADAADGSLDQLRLAPVPLSVVVLAKVAAHWLSTAVPLLVATPLVAVMLGLPPSALPRLLGALALGTPTLALLGAVGAALVVGARRGGALLVLLLLPLYVPVLIFGAAAVTGALDPAGGAGGATPFRMLAAFLLAALPLCPLAAALALRQATE